MPPKRLTRHQSTSKKTTDIEWLGGIASMPGYVMDEGEPYRPEVLFWMSGTGALLGTTLAKPGELLAMASESLQNTIDQPADGPPHRPTRVRVADPLLADALCAGHPGIEVICAPTPELDEMLAMMRERMEETNPTDPTYLSARSPQITRDSMAAFFKAAANLFRAQPWRLVPNDQELFSVTIEALGLHNAAMSVIGQMGQEFGLILFRSLADYETYLEAAEATERGQIPEAPPHFVLNYVRGADLPTALRKEIADHHWEVADANAYPHIMAIDGDLCTRPLDAPDITMFEAIALALSHILAEKKALREAWEGGNPVIRTLSMNTHAGEIEVTLSIPYMLEPIEWDASLDLIAALGNLSLDDEHDFDRYVALEDKLVRRFKASPEAKDLDELDICHIVLELGATYLGHTVATLRGPHLREVLFEILPRKVSIEASYARSIIEEIRALYAFLKREFKLKQADACRRVLEGPAVEKLEAALSDNSNFGMAKSMMMAGHDAGFDMQTPAGIEAWMQSMQGKPLPASIPLPGLPKPSSKKVTKANKKKAKAKKITKKAGKKKKH